MIKVVQLITSLDLGGAERVAINIAKSKCDFFEYHLVEVVKANSSYSHKLKEELRKEGICYHCSPITNRKIAILLFPFWFMLFYIKYRPDIIHAHTEIPDLALWLFRRISWILIGIKTKYVRTIHNTELWNDWKFVGNIVERFYIKHKCNIAISDSTQIQYKRQFGWESPIIYNGIEQVAQIPFPYIITGKINVLFAGRLEHQKGIGQLIAVVTAMKENRKFHFHIVGDGSMKEKVQTALGNFANVSLYDKIFSLNRYMSSFDYLFMPSNHEGLALMPIEASLAQTPTIINDCPGLKDTLPENWPLKVKDNNVDDFTRLFISLEKDPHYNEYAKTAYDFAITKFSIQKMQQEYERFYTA